MKQMNGYIDRPMDDYSAACNLQSKLWVSVALKKANIAVLYDERGQFRNAIFYYSEAVGLLHKAINNPQDLKSEIEGLAIISDIYLKRIQHLYNISQKQHTIIYAETVEYYSPTNVTYPVDKKLNDKEYIPEMIENVATNTKHAKHDSLSSTFSKLFSKKSLRVNTKTKGGQGPDTGILSPLKQFTRHSSLRSGKSSPRC